MVAACGSEPADMSSRQPADPDAFRQWRLPDRLREISGLALTPDGRLLAVTDESAIVYELDHSKGSILKAFGLGDPVVRGDFEGIAVLGDTVWLMTSDGRLLAATEGPDGRNVPYERYDTGLGDYCELEGLAQDRAAQTLLLACKEAKSKYDDLRIFELSLSAGRVERVRDVVVPEKSIAARIGEKRVNPAAIAVDGQTGEWVLVAARQAALIRLRADGSLSEAIILDKKGRHRQPEGIELTGDGRMLIADEGARGRARLAVYPAGQPVSQNDE